MELSRAIEKRKSVRSFKSKKASWKIVLEAIDAANKAPFAGNINHLKFVIIEDTKTIASLAKHANQDWIKECTILVAVCSNDTNLENMYGDRGRVYSRQTAGAAIQNLLLTLTNYGLASCWVGSYPDEHIRHVLKIPSHIQVEALIPIGYASPSLKEKKVRKKDLENTIFWEHWDQQNRPTIFPDAEVDTHPTK